MPVDAYSLCPGGSGRKIKFCCSDLLSELQTIDRMLDGEQNVACLQHVERLLQTHPDRECLLATKAMLLVRMGKLDDARATIARFIEKHPQNATAMAESAILTVLDGDGQAAIGLLQRALAASDDAVSGRLYEAIGTVAAVLLDEGDWLPARALLRLQAAIAADDPDPVAMLVEFNRSASIPSLFKDDLPLLPGPQDEPWKARFAEAMAPIGKGNWQLAAQRLDALAAELGDSPAVWQNLATLRGWLGDRPGCIDALRKYAALAADLEDAVEAEALAMLLSDDPLGDRRDILMLRFTITDFEQLQAALTLDSRAVQMPFDPSAFSPDDGPPPKAAYLLLDRPAPQTPEHLTLESLPQVIGQAMVYGRQTDREARLEVLGVLSTDRQKLKALLAEMVGDALGSDVEEEVIGEVSASRELLLRNWYPPRDIDRQQVESLTVEHQRRALLHLWPDLELGIFDGKSARQVAGEGAWRVRLLAALLLLEMAGAVAPDSFDFNELRSQLGLPTLGPIDPQQVPLAELRLVRLGWVIVEKASDAALQDGFRRAAAFAVSSALRKFALAIVDRPSLAGREDQLLAYSALARLEKDPDRALQYIEQGRSAARAAGHSCAAWDLMELTPRLHRREAEDLSRLVDHLRNRHLEEPGVAEALANFLVRVGALRPDGTPTGPSSVAPPSPTESPLPAAAEAAAPGQIWTPGSQQPGSTKKLWTPD